MAMLLRWRVKPTNMGIWVSSQPHLAHIYIYMMYNGVYIDVFVMGIEWRSNGDMGYNDGDPACHGDITAIYWDKGFAGFNPAILRIGERRPEIYAMFGHRTSFLNHSKISPNMGGTEKKNIEPPTSQNLMKGRFTMGKCSVYFEYGKGKIPSSL